MKVISQNKIQKSVFKHLIPAPYLLDSRTEMDDLNTVTNISSLINYYNQDNAVDGNWSSFLLKDPVFLVATIAKTPFEDYYTLFTNSYKQLNNVVLKKITKNFISNGFNQLFDILIDVYKLIEKWSFFMLLSDYTYNLKTYLLNEVKATYSALLWAILEFKSQLYLKRAKLGIDKANITDFEAFNPQYWKESKGKMPYWEILDLPTYPNKPNSEESTFYITRITEQDILDALKLAGKQLFGFFNNCISYANVDFKNVKKLSAQYPDTLLIRTFIDVLKQYKKKINTLSSKHLEFYYNAILKQQKQKAIPDQAFLSCSLNKKAIPYVLENNTLFNAGLDINNNPILFSTTKPVVLNAATIASAYTLTPYKEDNDTFSLYKYKAPQTGVIDTNQNNATTSWKTFGSNITPQGDKVELAFAFASPMLYLSQSAALRDVVIAFNFNKALSANQIELFKISTTYFLSTESNWFKLDKTASGLNISCTKNQLTISFSLDATSPSIVNFTKNPDGYTSIWPLFKMVFSNYEHLATPPKIDTITIDVRVEGLNNFTLYNDYGALSVKKPFQPLGITPDVDQNFMIGSNEVFSKPITNLTLNLNWNGIPKDLDFSTYYSAYNDYLNGDYVTLPINLKKIKKSDAAETIPKAEENDLNTISEHSSERLMTSQNAIFTNKSFKVDFQILQNGVWQTIDTGAKTLFDESAKAVIEQTKTFQFNDSHNTFSEIDPNIQKSTLKFTDTSSSGFIKMQLTDPDQGFGAQLYAKVVNAIALYNGLQIATKGENDEKIELVSPANPPFTPVLKSFTGNYNASKTYAFNNEDDTYPLECFYYTPFNNYNAYNTNVGVLVNGPLNTEPTLALYPSLKGKGHLLIALETVTTETDLNLYFELSRNTSKTSDETKQIIYYYLSNTGWKKLPKISDTTNCFNCSGIVTFSIPADISNSSAMMAGNYYWIAINTISAPDTYGSTSFYSINGVEVKRVLDSKNSPVASPLTIKANTITGPSPTIPEIEKTLQPFASFGGVQKETPLKMNERVSYRLKTKGRLVNISDYYDTLQLYFPWVFYSKTIYNKTTKTLTTYLIKKVANQNSTNAFLPLVSECQELKVQSFITQRASAFIKAEVSNFKIKYLKITATIQLDKTSQPNHIAPQINNAINVFLSPWITSKQSQIEIDEGISTAQLMAFIKTFSNVVVSINDISFQLGQKDPKTDVITYADSVQDISKPKGAHLIVPSLNNLTNNSTIVYVI